MTSLQKMQQIILSSRPISWVNTAYPFAAGFIMNSHQFDDVTLYIGAFYFLIPYNLLMYGINDVFDYESDLRNPRKGGAEGALLHKPLHNLTLWASILLNIPFVVYLLIIGSLAANIALLVLLFFVVAYSAPVLRFKERPVLDSFTSSTHFCGPLLYALILTHFQPQAWSIIIAFFLWGMASHAFGAVQDIIADRAGNIKSVATALGAPKTVRLSIILYLLSGLILILPGDGSSWAGLLAIPYILSIWPYRNITDEHCEQANVAWKRFIYLNWVTGAIVTIMLITSY